MALPDAEIAQAGADPGHVGHGTDRPVPLERPAEGVDCLLFACAAREQDSEIFGGGGTGPRVLVLYRSPREAFAVSRQEAPGVRRSGCDGLASGILLSKSASGGGGSFRHRVIAGGKCGADQPGSEHRVAEEHPP
jgi:hypothetical protein